MNATLLIARHELRRLAVQWWAWALAAATLGLLAYYFLLALDAFLALSPKIAAHSDAPGVTDLVAVPILRMLGSLFLLLLPLLGMRAIAGERRANSLALLLAAGVGDAPIVLGKWLAVWGYALVLIALALLLPLSLGLGTTLDGGKLAATVLGLALEAGALAAIAVWASSLTEHPSFAAAIAIATNLLLTVLDAGARMQGVSNGFINYLALPTHIEPFCRGIVSSVDAIYFALIALLALALATRRVDALRSDG
jgi:ABC-2 type transport system permease protein